MLLKCTRTDDQVVWINSDYIIGFWKKSGTELTSMKIAGLTDLELKDKAENLDYRIRKNAAPVEDPEKSPGV